VTTGSRRLLTYLLTYLLAQYIYLLSGTVWLNTIVSVCFSLCEGMCMCLFVFDLYGITFTIWLCKWHCDEDDDDGDD